MNAACHKSITPTSHVAKRLFYVTRGLGFPRGPTCGGWLASVGSRLKADAVGIISEVPRSMYSTFTSRRPMLTMRARW